MTTYLPVLCNACSHLRPGAGCDAYPDGIPDAIGRFGGDHHAARPGDHGIRFEQAPGADAAQALEDWRATFGRV